MRASCDLILVTLHTTVTYISDDIHRILQCTSLAESRYTH